MTLTQAVKVIVSGAVRNAVRLSYGSGAVAWTCAYLASEFLLDLLRKSLELDDFFDEIRIKGKHQGVVMFTMGQLYIVGCIVQA